MKAPKGKKRKEKINSKNEAKSSAVAPNKEESKLIPDYIIDNCAKHPNKVFLTQSLRNGIIKDWTFSHFLSESQKMAAHIESLNLAVPS